MPSCKRSIKISNVTFLNPLAIPFYLEEVLLVTWDKRIYCISLKISPFCRYERFLKIMILSVLKNTQRPVKFWFIKNYLSPQFKVCLYCFLFSFFVPFPLTSTLQHLIEPCIIESSILIINIISYTGCHTSHGSRVWVPIWTHHIQVANMAA